MDAKTFFAYFSLLVPFLAAGLGFVIKQNIEQKHLLENEVNRERREHYQEFVDVIVDMLKNTKLNQPIDSSFFLQRIYDFYKKYILYASPEVINSFSDYFQFLYHVNDSKTKVDPYIYFVKLTKIMYDMRSDLGLNNDHLGENGEKLLRGMMNDFDIVFPNLAPD